MADEYPQSATAPSLTPPDAPEPLSGWAMAGYILLLLAGVLLALGGIGYMIVVLVVGGAIFDTALAIGLAAVGTGIVVHSTRALDPRRYQEMSLLPEWAWTSSMVFIWAAGLVLTRALPEAQGWFMPPLIVAGAWTMSLFFLRAAIHGLRSPAGRTQIDEPLPPRFRVYLSTTVSAALSTGLALLLEGIALVGTLAIMLATTQVLGDQDTVTLLTEIADDPQAMQRLEEAITRSPAALAGLGSILVLIAPAIEEGVKAIPLFFFARQREQLSERRAILLGVACGVGFAFAENVGYLSAFAETWSLIFWFRAAAAVMHGAASGYVGRAWYHGVHDGKWGKMLLDLCRGWGIHAFWNGLALAMGWFAYQEMMVGVLFCVGLGLVPLAVLFGILARWGIWVNET